MKLLLDTHVLLWWTTADRRLTAATRELISSADHDVAVSAATFWEIAIKIALGRITIDLRELLSSVDADGFDELPVRASDTLQLTALPSLHTDPFDRLLIAQAVAGSFHLVTHDETILRYEGVAGFTPIRA